MNAKFPIVVALLLICAAIAPATYAQSDEELPYGQSVECDDGVSFDNGVAVTVLQMRTGSTYRVTAIGLDGFDPVLAVLDEFGVGLCSDDDPNAALYDARLPTTGTVDPSELSSQILFTNNLGGDFADVSFVVGGHRNSSGEFLLILEGMTLSAADGAGDPFAVLINQSLVDAGVPLNGYMISVTDAFDPAIVLIDDEYNVITDDDGFELYCDDAGDDNLCYSESSSLASSYVSRTRGQDIIRLPGGPLDAQFELPLDDEFVGFEVTYLMTTVQETYGDYVVVFHMGVGEPETATAVK